jgi:hypothetical protein
VNNINGQLDATVTILLIIELAQNFSGKKLPERCWADSKINEIIIVACSWSFILVTYKELHVELQEPISVGRRYLCNSSVSDTGNFVYINLI